MSQHLSSEQISEWMAGERTAQMKDHLGQCPECSAEIARVEAALATFRSSVREWSDQQSSPEIARTWITGRESRALLLQPVRWALIAAALLMLAAIPIYQGAKEKQRRAEAAR